MFAAAILAASSGTAYAASLGTPVLTGAPTGVTNSTSASIAYSADGEGTASVLCSFDGHDSEWSECPESPIILTDLEDGPHSIAVKAVSGPLFQIGDVATASWVVDTTAPPPPNVESPTDGATVTDSDSVPFSASGESGASLECSLDSGSWIPCPVASGPSPGDKGRFAVGWDTILHWGESSDWTQMRWGQTNRDGSIQWNGEMPRSNFGGGPVTLATIVHSIMASLACPYIAGLAPSFGLFVVAGTSDGAKWNSYALDCASTTSEVPEPTPGRLGSLADGPHTLSVRQIDLAGNASDPTTVTWLVDTTAPPAPHLTNVPASPTKATSASIGVSGEDGATLTCSIDSGDWGPCSSPVNLSHLSDGEHRLAVKQTDGAGRESGEASASWAVDTIAPEPPSFTATPLALSKASNSTIVIARSELGGTLQCRLDARAWATCPETVLFRLLSSGTHTAQIRQRDDAGNVSAVKSTSWAIDVTPPGKPVLGNLPRSRTNLRGVSIAVTRAEPGGTLECNLDSRVWVGCSQTVTYRLLARGPHTLLIRQRDEAGNGGAAETVEWTVDVTAPAKPAIISAPPAFSDSRSAAVTVGRSEPGGRLECKLDTRAWATCEDETTFKFLHAGARVVLVRQRDDAGNAGPSSAVLWTVDVTPPAKPVLSDVPSSPTTARSVSITITRSEDGGTLECKLDRAPWATCTSPASFTGLPVGLHVLLVRQRDAAGNASAMTFAKATWLVR